MEDGNGDVPTEAPPPENQLNKPKEEVADMTVPVTPAILKNWLRRCRRNYRHGVLVVKVGSGGKLLRRVVHIGAKPEYFEISSAKPFNFAYHMCEIESVTAGCDSPDFVAYNAHGHEKSPRKERSCVVVVESRTISLVFKSESDRRDFMFLIRVDQQAIRQRYAFINQRFNERQRMTSDATRTA